MVEMLSVGLEVQFAAVLRNAFQAPGDGGSFFLGPAIMRRTIGWILWVLELRRGSDKLRGAR